MKHFYIPNPFNTRDINDPPYTPNKGDTLEIGETEDDRILENPDVLVLASFHEDGTRGGDPIRFPQLPEIEIEPLKAWSPFVTLTVKECGAKVLVNRDYIFMVGVQTNGTPIVHIKGYGPLETEESIDEVEKLILGEDETDGAAAPGGEGDAAASKE